MYRLREYKNVCKVFYISQDTHDMILHRRIHMYVHALVSIYALFTHGTLNFTTRKARKIIESKKIPNVRITVYLLSIQRICILH